MLSMAVYHPQECPDVHSAASGIVSDRINTLTADVSNIPENLRSPLYNGTASIDAPAFSSGDDPTKRGAYLSQLMHYLFGFNGVLPTNTKVCSLPETAPASVASLAAALGPNGPLFRSLLTDSVGKHCRMRVDACVVLPTWVQSFLFQKGKEGTSGYHLLPGPYQDWLSPQDGGFVMDADPACYYLTCLLLAPVPSNLANTPASPAESWTPAYKQLYVAVFEQFLKACLPLDRSSFQQESNTSFLTTAQRVSEAAAKQAQKVGSNVKGTCDVDVALHEAAQPSAWWSQINPFRFLFGRGDGPGDGRRVRVVAPGKVFIPLEETPGNTEAKPGDAESEERVSHVFEASLFPRHTQPHARMDAGDRVARHFLDTIAHLWLDRFRVRHTRDGPKLERMPLPHAVPLHTGFRAWSDVQLRCVRLLVRHVQASLAPEDWPGPTRMITLCMEEETAARLTADQRRVTAHLEQPQHRAYTVVEKLRDHVVVTLHRTLYRAVKAEMTIAQQPERLTQLLRLWVRMCSPWAQKDGYAIHVAGIPKEWRAYLLTQAATYVDGVEVVLKACAPHMERAMQACVRQGQQAVMNATPAKVSVNDPHIALVRLLQQVLDLIARPPHLWEFLAGLQNDADGVCVGAGVTALQQRYQTLVSLSRQHSLLPVPASVAHVAARKATMPVSEGPGVSDNPFLAPASPVSLPASPTATAVGGQAYNVARQTRWQNLLFQKVSPAEVDATVAVAALADPSLNILEGCLLDDPALFASSVSSFPAPSPMHEWVFIPALRIAVAFKRSANHSHADMLKAQTWFRELSWFSRAMHYLVFGTTEQGRPGLADFTEATNSLARRWSDWLVDAGRLHGMASNVVALILQEEPASWVNGLIEDPLAEMRPSPISSFTSLVRWWHAAILLVIAVIMAWIL